MLSEWPLLSLSLACDVINDSMLFSVLKVGTFHYGTRQGWVFFHSAGVTELTCSVTGDSSAAPCIYCCTHYAIIPVAMQNPFE